MPLSPGARLGPYEIVGQIGAGGMGEVWKAKDTKLGRDVAIKVLPEVFAAEAERLKRFEQEARTLSALNHPNILTIHDFGSHEGSPYLVMELLEGETLREKLGGTPLGGKPLPARKAAEIAAQVAKGLSAAHEQGIIHRDLKPENLFISKNGHVKILDFGLAKILAPESLPALGHGSTVALGTKPGMVMGTVGYMAPEQVRGETVGPPGDLFALGCVLYEMLTGRRAFRGDSAIGVLHAILNDDPLKDASGLQGLPPALARTLERCLEKAPGDRFRSAHDLAFALQDAALSGSGPTPAAAGARASGRPTWIWVLVGLLVLAAGTGGWFLGKGRAQSPAAAYTPVTFRRGAVPSARFAADGRSILYTAAWRGQGNRLYLKRPDQDDATTVGPPGALLLAVSRKGELALLLNWRPINGFFGLGTLARMSEQGGDAPRLIEDSVAAADWSPAGDLAVVKDLGDRQRLEFPLGTPIHETKGWLSDLRFSPDGRELAFLDHPLRQDGSCQPVRVEIGSGQVSRPDPAKGTYHCRGLAWSPDGRELLAGNRRNLLALDRTWNRRFVGRFPREVNLQDVARDGRILLGQETRQMGMEGRDERGQRELSWLFWSLVMDLSADGRQVLFTEFGRMGADAVALRGLDGSPVVQLGEGGIATGISRDGRWVAVVDRAATRIDLLPTGPGSPRRLAAPGLTRIAHARFLPDGRSVVFYAEREGRPGLFVQPVDGGEARAVGGERPGFGTIEVAPGGDRFLAAGLDGAPWVFSLDGSARLLPGCSAGDRAVHWDASGRFAFVYREGELPAKIRRVDVASGRSEAVAELSLSDPDGVQWLSPVTMTADAKRFAFSYYRVLSELHVVEGLK